MRDIVSTKAVWPPPGDDEKRPGSMKIILLTFVLPALLVVALLLLLAAYQGGIETAVANVALLLPVGYAFAAGMVASVNPCGIMMLSSYAFYQVRTGDVGASLARRAVWGVLVATAVTLGFVVIFAFVGAIVAAGGSWLVNAFPYAGVILGAGMITLGIWLLATRRTLGLVAGKQASLNPGRSLGNAFLFGLVYAVASLSCTLPIFLAVVGGTLASQGLLHSLGQFVGYALGMGAAIFVVVIGAVFARRTMARWLRALTPYVHRLSAMFLVGAGIYLLYYWLIQGRFLF